VASAFPGRDDPLNHIGEEQRSYPVVVVRRGKGQDGGDLHRERGLGYRLAESSRSGLIHHQHDGELPLLGKCLDIRTGQAGGHVPVDRAEVVAVLVCAHLGEFHSLPPKHRAVLAREQRAHEAPRSELDGLDLFEDLGRDGWHGCEF
jgi:hypothetical protein